MSFWRALSFMFHDHSISLFFEYIGALIVCGATYVSIPLSFRMLPPEKDLFDGVFIGTLVVSSTICVSALVRRYIESPRAFRDPREEGINPDFVVRNLSRAISVVILMFYPLGWMQNIERYSLELLLLPTAGYWMLRFVLAPVVLRSLWAIYLMRFNRWETKEAFGYAFLD